MTLSGWIRHHYRQPYEYCLHGDKVGIEWTSAASTFLIALDTPLYHLLALNTSDLLTLFAFGTPPPSSFVLFFSSHHLSFVNIYSTIFICSLLTIPIFICSWHTNPPSIIDLGTPCHTLHSCSWLHVPPHLAILRDVLCSASIFLSTPSPMIVIMSAPQSTANGRRHTPHHSSAVFCPYQNDPPGCP